MVNHPPVCGMQLITHKDCIKYAFISVYHVHVSNTSVVDYKCLLSKCIKNSVPVFYNIYQYLYIRDAIFVLCE